MVGKQSFVDISRLPSIYSRESKAPGYSFLHCLGRTGLVALPLIVWFHFMWYSQLCQECASHKLLFCLFFHFKVTALPDWRHNRLDMLYTNTYFKLSACTDIHIKKPYKDEDESNYKVSSDVFISWILQWCVAIIYKYNIHLGNGEKRFSDSSSFLVQEMSGTTAKV